MDVSLENAHMFENKQEERNSKEVLTEWCTLISLQNQLKSSWVLNVLPQQVQANNTRS
jgi:hypothetical protein